MAKVLLEGISKQNILLLKDKNITRMEIFLEEFFKDKKFMKEK
jgi:hypothetical protein